MKNFMPLPLLFVLLSSSMVRAQDVVAIAGVAVVDVEAGEVRPDWNVVVSGDRIVAIGPAVRTPVPAGASIVDGRGRWLVPGFFDAHVHYVDPETHGPLLIAHGVTFVREMGSDTDRVLAIRRRLAAGELVGPEMAATGAILDGSPPTWPFSIECTTPDEGRAAVGRLRARGVDAIKVYSGLDPETYRAIVEEARRVGLGAVGHVPYGVAIEEALEAGQTSIEHLTGFDARIGELAGREVKPAGAFRHWLALPEVPAEELDAFVRRVADSGTYLCPTLVVYDRIGRMKDPALRSDPALAWVAPGFLESWDPAKDFRFEAWTDADFERMRRALVEQQRLVGQLARAGARIVAGTDLGNPFVVAGASLHDEMRFLARSGLGPAAVLRAATSVPAALCGVADRLGTLERGKTASMVLLAADPLADVANSSRIAGVFVRGRFFDRAALDRMLEDVRGRVAATGRPPEAELVLPGEVVARGRYAMRLGGRDAGDERFLVTKDETGWYVAAHHRPAGGFQAPSRTMVHVGPDLAFLDATWIQTNLSVAYSRMGDRVLAEAERGGEKEEPRIYALEGDARVSGPAHALDFLDLRAAGLAVGEEAEFPMLGFGFPSWELEATSYVLQRLADDEGRAHYAFVLTTSVGETKGEIWVDERGVPLRKAYDLPWGRLEIVRVD